MELIEALNWRYATKKMNGQSVPQEKVNRILEAARLAPTSAGIQPFSVIVVTNPELKKQILPIANNQSQMVDSSHLLIFAAWDNITKERIEENFVRTTTQRGMPLNAMDDFKNRLVGMFEAKTAEENFQHAARQTYIAFGMALTAAAVEKVDSTPMEGFNAAELDKLLNLKEKGLRSVALMPLGYRDEANDWLAKLKKVRQGEETFVINFN
jgi:nitroreductase/dihydropteridine reductase